MGYALYTFLALRCGVHADADGRAGWAKFMEWNYPVEVVFTSKKTFRAAGAIEAAVSL